MIRAKTYETVSKFVKVMTKILWTLFSGHGVYYLLLQQYRINTRMEDGVQRLVLMQLITFPSLVRVPYKKWYWY